MSLIQKCENKSLSITDLQMLLAESIMDGNNQEKEIKKIISKYEDDTLSEADIQKLLPKKKLTRNRDDKIPDESWIISNENLEKYEKLAKESVQKQAKAFLNLIYKDRGYIEHFKNKKIKRGCNSINWKENGNYLCESLHKATNIYDAIGKKKWCNVHGRNPVADTWINEPDPETKCVVITKKGSQCKRSRCKESDRCTQHFKLL